jgi:hypothetical protein
MASPAYDVNRDKYPSGVEANWQARQARSVTPSDTLSVTDASGDASPTYYKALYVGVTGDVKVVMAGDITAANPVTFKAVPVGFMPIQVRQVFATGTTATNIIGLFD